MITDKQALERWQEHVKNVFDATPINKHESPEDKAARIHRARHDFGYMVSYYFPHYCTTEQGVFIPSPDFHIDLAGKVKRGRQIAAIVRWGRGLAKSVVCDIFIPLWLWMCGEDLYVVIVGNNEDKARILLSDLQAEFENNRRLIWDFGSQVQQGSWTSGYFCCKDRFVAKAIGMGQDARGLRKGKQRPTLLIIDDIEDKDTIKNPRIQDDIVRWIEGSLIPTMDGPTARVIDVNNNFAPRTIQSLLEQRHPCWLVHRVDACPGAARIPRWADKYPEDYYLQMEQKIGTIALESEYNNTPFTEGKVFTEQLIQWVPLPRLDHFEFIVGHWDPAYSGNNDYNAIRVWGLKEHKFYLIACMVRQCKMPQALDWIYDYERDLPPSVIIHWRVESQFWNDPMREAIYDKEMELGYSFNITEQPSPKTKKLDRMLGMLPYYQNGRIFYNIKLKGSNDCSVGLAQLYGIEPGYRTHDDAPDADERAVSDLVQVDRAMSFEPVFNPISHSGMW